MRYYEIIVEANDLFLHKHFGKCLDVCQRYSKEAKTHLEDPGAISATEVFSVLAIQSYAELNQWEQVLPFVTEQYSGIEQCTSSVVQLCILLHAQVQDYATCTAIAHIWLHHPDNCHRHDYAVVSELFITHVLIPQRRWEDIPAFIDSCSGLDAKTKSTYMKHVWSLRHQEEQENINEIEDLGTNVDEPTSDQPLSGCVTDCSWLDNYPCYVQFIGNWVSRHMHVASLQTVRNIALAAVVAYLLVIRYNSGVFTWKRLHVLWTRLVKILFSPLRFLKI
ncbi:hypothetical protein LSAT2_028535 [Lamellibrachia satsuma]|nr:hypothetical protein LSAT2_028535 [Lamellibrachia satsuma]